MLLAGRSYGGAVISSAGASAPNVVGLVFRRLRPRRGGRRQSRASQGQHPEHGPGQYNAAGPGGDRGRFGINPALLREVFAADLPPETTALMAATQRPVAAAAFTDVCGPAAQPEATVLGRGRSDKAAGADLVSHAGGLAPFIVEVEGSHVIMISSRRQSPTTSRAAQATVGSGR